MRRTYWVENFAQFPSGSIWTIKSRPEPVTTDAPNEVCEVYNETLANQIATWLNERQPDYD